MNAMHKILSLVFVQAILIVSSFFITAYIELQYSISGQLIDITGKNRLLANTVQLETYRALFHDSATHMHVVIAVEELENNTALLRHGGILDGLVVPPVPPELHSELDEMEVAVDQYAAAVTEIINAKESLTYDSVESVHLLSNTIIGMANSMTNQLSVRTDAATTQNSLLLIFLGLCNIAVLVLITFLVRSLIKKHVDRTVQIKRFEALGKFSAVMAHNIRNPLGSLLNSIKLIKKYNLDLQFDNEVARMERSTKRIGHHIEGILNFVNNTPLNMRPTMLLNTLRNSVDMLTLPKNIDLRIPDDDQNVTVECDDKKIEFVFYNLLLNAVQAIGVNQGRIVVRISGGDGDENGAVILQFENSGPLIPPHVFPRLFDPLFTTKKNGMGLGLAYCKNIIELHKGHITASNRDGLVLFSIRLPQTHIISTDAEAYVESR